MRAFIDLSGTDNLPVASKLVECASSLSHCGSRVGESIRRAHAKWSGLAAVYTAPEQSQVHRALDRPRDAGEAVLESATLAAAGLETFAAAVDGIRLKRLELQSAVDKLQAEEPHHNGPGGVLLEGNSPLTLPAHLLQARADELARELRAAEDECIRTLRRLAAHNAEPGARGLQPI